MPAAMAGLVAGALGDRATDRRAPLSPPAAGCLRLIAYTG
jgi:hypothetical protein